MMTTAWGHNSKQNLIYCFCLQIQTPPKLPNINPQLFWQCCQQTNQKHDSNNCKQEQRKQVKKNNNNSNNWRSLELTKQHVLYAK